VNEFINKPEPVLMEELNNVFICTSDVLIPAGLKYVYINEFTNEEKYYLNVYVAENVYISSSYAFIIF
jgi:hypothetical protein